MEEMRVRIPEGTEAWEVGFPRPPERRTAADAGTAPAFQWSRRRPRRPKPLVRCERCRGLVVGWNERYLNHQLVCMGKLLDCMQAMVYAVALALAVFILPATSGAVFHDPVAVAREARFQAERTAREAAEEARIQASMLSSAVERARYRALQAVLAQAERSRIQAERNASEAARKERLEVELEKLAAAEVPVIGYASEPQFPDDPLASGIRRIVIDAGHGGLDTGSIGPSGLTEKELVLDIAGFLRTQIESGLGAEVVLTRSRDIFVPLETRTEIANRFRADLFISIHANASQREASRGFETYFLDDSGGGVPGDASREFAVHVQNALATRLPFGEDRGVKSAALAVLSGATMPSVLAEVSFISNPEDERLLKETDYRRRIASALFEGVRSYSETLGPVQIASAGD